MLTQSREFVIKEKFFTATERMEIMDPRTQQLMGYFRSKFLTLPKKYWLTFPNDQPLIGIQRKMFTWFTKFDFFEGGPSETLTENQYLGTLEKKFALFSSKYHFRAPNGMILYEMYGNFWGRSFQILEDGRQVADISKKFWSWTDTYGIRIDPNKTDQEAMILLTMVVVLDYIHDRNSRNND